MYLHHTGQDPEKQDRSRGSSALKANLDFEYKIELRDGVRSLSQKKVKDGRIQKALHFRLEDVTINGWFDEDGEPEASAVLLPCEAPERPKTKLQQDNQEIAEAALDEYGKLDGNGDLIISRADLLKGIAGKLKDSNKVPLDRERLQQELTPSRKSGFVNSLVSCGFWETIRDEANRKCTPEGWRVLDPAAVFRWNLDHGKDQEPDLEGL